MKVNQNFAELLSCLVERDVRFLIVGGYALAAHGHPRYTKDLDVWVWMDPTNAESVVQALGDFGFGELGLTASDFMVSDTVVQLGFPPQRVDILTTPDGVEFLGCWERRFMVAIDGLEVPFINREDLIENKLASGRGVDLVDVENLRADDNR